MKVILLQDVAKIGLRGSVVEVPDGYAQNKLIPKKLAQPATPANLKRAQQKEADIQAQNSAAEVRYQETLQALKEKTITVKAEANDQNHLFKAVSEAEIIEAAKEEGITLESAMLQIPQPIKSLGEHELQLVWKSSKNIFTVEVVKK